MHGNWNRRDFLGRTMTAGAALAAWSQTAGARAQESPQEKIVLAVMGTNGRGAGLARGFAEQPGAAIAYICDVDEQAVGKGVQAVESAERPAPRGLVDFRHALDDPSVDALVIAAPDHWHAPAAILACAAGKHVYVEKPASHNGREGELMVAAARRHGRLMQLGTQRRSSPGVIEAIRLVQTGRIGRALFARGWITSIRPSIGQGRETSPPAHLNYDLWQGPAPERPYRDNLIHYHWHWFWHWGTGELGNNGIHALDLCRWGLEVDYPHQVVCGGGKLHFQDDQETPDTQLATFHFGDKAIHWEHRTWNRRGLEADGFGVAFYGEAGSLVLAGDQATVYDAEGRQSEQVPTGASDADHLRNFLEAIRGQTALSAEIEEGVKSTAMCHLGNIAYRTRRTVNFDPAARQLSGDDEAAALWSREYRPGWEPGGS